MTCFGGCMKRQFCCFLFIIFVLNFSFSGDIAVFKDLGFSQDGKSYAFAQYGVTDKDYIPYGEIYTINIAENEYIPKGVFRKTDSSFKNGEAVYTHLAEKNKDFLAKYKFTPISLEDTLYINSGTKTSSDAIRFKDFSSTETIYYNIKLVPFIEGKGLNCYSSFYIIIEKQDETGKTLAKKVAGTPSVKRKGVSNYSIETIYHNAESNNFIFIVEKQIQTDSGVSVRYMAEALEF